MRFLISQQLLAFFALGACESSESSSSGSESAETAPIHCEFVYCGNGASKYDMAHYSVVLTSAETIKGHIGAYTRARAGGRWREITKTAQRCKLEARKPFPLTIEGEWRSGKYYKLFLRDASGQEYETDEFYRQGKKFTQQRHSSRDSESAQEAEDAKQGWMPIFVVASIVAAFFLLVYLAYKYAPRS
ncbi:hypothetical protein PAPHI01_0115 [Pancytospora philotis]|nr:hypothetical protein PAPHI01_0115 [Pancytospora philotis]